MNEVILTILVVFAAVGFTISGTLILRKIFGHEHLSRHNEVAGFIYAVIGVVYAVLLAFVVIVVWEDFQEAEDIVDQEAASVTVLYSLLQKLDKSGDTNMKKSLVDYTETVVQQEWLMLKEGETLKDFSQMPGDKYYKELHILLENYIPRDDNETIWYEKAIDELKTLNEKRKLRYYSTKLSVPTFIWIVIIIGGFLSVIYAMLFSSQNLWAQLVMLSILSISITLVIYLIFALDHPYRGLIVVSPESFEMFLNSLK
jgi:hypothetical protein